VGQEYFINNQELENKVRDLLPSQGGAGAGFDLSASTQIIPIIDLTESAEGSNVRADLQSALYFGGATVFNVSNGTTTVINTTGYWRVFGSISLMGNGSGDENAQILLNDGASTKNIYEAFVSANTGNPFSFQNFDFTVFLGAGESLQMISSNTQVFLQGSVRQIADIDGNLVTPS